ncbi:DUF7639 domain-containing protein [Streptomyces sp. DT224]|uniref:DUF7639 domain-containing protein n=1 Tax=Streptomyces sp. DT224 TaxID=3393426 RepID=UPI003CEE15A1
MTWRWPTYRMVDGEGTDGAWCHIWRRNERGGGYYVDDLAVFADGRITCGERTDLAGLAEAGRGPWDGDRPGGATASRPAVEVGVPLRRTADTEGFLLEVADRIEALNGRPTARQRCWDAIRQYEQQPTGPNRQLLRAAHLAVPAHLRIYVLGDMDRPLRILLTDIDEAVDGDGPVVTAGCTCRTRP